MQFKLTEERQMLQDGLRRYLADSTDHEKIAAATDGATGLDHALWDGLAEMGLPGAMFTEDQGGFGGEGFDIMTVAEELGRAGLPTPLIDSALLSGTVLAETRPELTQDLVAGKIVGFAHAEPGARYDLAHVATRAEKTAEGWTLTGNKAIVQFALAADGFVVSARTSGATDAKEGISLFLVPHEHVTLRDYPLNGGGRAAEMTLDATLPEDALLGEAGAAYALIETAHARAIAGQCAEALGLMETIKDLTVDYLRQRRQFGQPIGKFQALQHRMADVLIEIEQARSAVINLCGNLDTPERDLHVSAAKNLIGRVARQVVEESIQMHGGIGMTMEYALGHFAKRLSMVDHRFGDADTHLERFIHLSQSAA
ncbi:acyl-CoA dehydrogenase family protein [Tropicibacter naphthalenivorans]|uniref:Acyl-CoA dehydrogenase n=1 Tax=Tropicibacter naphthalenivorans TaxID=441103 RepID=A0A0P1GI07_9RHOB|nr:acyl-CoA dehydrogenase [Tropicibacter naphthalenivorans]CUH81648.1 Acyl-CoA dehydrogenase [Tropicibacter naphthalenivorans]SMC99471.1 Acyl-CoA dehydrogenase [Tropicibacter naphthalenivorans]